MLFQHPCRADQHGLTKARADQLNRQAGIAIKPHRDNDHRQAKPVERPRVMADTLYKACASVLAPASLAARSGSRNGQTGVTGQISIGKKCCDDPPGKTAAQVQHLSQLPVVNMPARIRMTVWGFISRW